MPLDRIGRGESFAETLLDRRAAVDERTGREHAGRGWPELVAGQAHRLNHHLGFQQARAGQFHAADGALVGYLVPERTHVKPGLDAGCVEPGRGQVPVRLFPRDIEQQVQPFRAELLGDHGSVHRGIAAAEDGDRSRNRGATTFPRRLEKAQGRPDTVGLAERPFVPATGREQHGIVVFAKRFGGDIGSEMDGEARRSNGRLEQGIDFVLRLG